MASADFSDREQLDQATSLLMASLRQSRALNIEIREALQRREQAEAIEQVPEDRSVFRILSDVIESGPRPSNRRAAQKVVTPGRHRRPGKTAPLPGRDNK